MLSQFRKIIEFRQHALNEMSRIAHAQYEIWNWSGIVFIYAIQRSDTNINNMDGGPQS
jgi:hypothetical protein